MEFTWNDVIIRAQQIPGNSRPRRSKRNGLTMVFEQAQPLLGYDIYQ